MIRNLARGSLGVTLVLALLIGALAVPAFAAPPQGTAQITTARQLMAGTTGQTFNVQVTNPAAGLDSQVVEYVNVFPPAGDLDKITPTPPQGWQATVLAGGARILYHGGRLLPGQSQTFGFTADVKRPFDDVTRTWGVSASSDGFTSSSYLPASEGALTTVFRVLQVTGVSITAPAEAADGTVTAGQDNIQLTLSVRSEANAPKSVTPSISDTAGAFSVLSGNAAQPIATSETRDFVLGLKVANDAGGKTTAITGRAVGGSSTAFTAATGNISIQVPALLDFIENTLQPKVLNPDGTTLYQFRGDFKNTGNVAIESLAGSYLMIAGQRAELESPVRMAPTGSGDAVQFVFEPITIPTSVPDDAYTPKLHIEAVDANGVPFTPVLDLDIVAIDRTVPIPAPLLTPPKSLVKGEADAAGNAQTVTFGGQVTKAGNLCTACVLVEASLLEYTSASASEPSNRQALSTGGTNPQISLRDGEITGSASPTFASSTTRTALEIVVRAPSGVEGDAESAKVLVDTVAPQLLSAKTGGPSGQNRTRIDLTLSERSAFPQGQEPSDWQVDENIVESVQITDSKGIGKNDDNTIIGDRVQLILSRALSEDAKPTVTYRPSVASNKAHDRVDRSLTSNPVRAVDGILPAVPDLRTVGGQAIQTDGPGADGDLGTEDDTKAFFTNQSDPTFVLGNVTVGHTVYVYRDDNGNGRLDAGEREIGRGNVQEPGPLSQPEVRIVPKSGESFTTDERLRILWFADDGTNFGPAAGNTLVLDFTAPEVSGFAQLPDNVVDVSFSEPVTKGRNSSLDWTVSDGTNAYNVGEVAGNWNVRTLIIDDFRYGASVDLTKIYYEYFGAAGPSGGEYRDRAGNALGYVEVSG